MSTVRCIKNKLGAKGKDAWVTVSVNAYHFGLVKHPWGGSSWPSNPLSRGCLSLWLNVHEEQQAGGSLFSMVKAGS